MKQAKPRPGGYHLPAIILFILMMAPVPARANVVWPALYLETRLLTWWAVSAGLLIEYLFLRQFLGFGIKKSILADICMNLVSTVLGIVLIPLAGIALELYPGSVIQAVFQAGTFNPVTWAMTFLYAVAINAALESLVIRWLLKTRIGGRGFLCLFAANTVSVGVAIASLFVLMPRL